MQWFLVFILIGVAGGAGSVIRALLTRFDGWLPYGLFLANSLAAGLVGWLVVGSTLTAGYLTLTTSHNGGQPIYPNRCAHAGSSNTLALLQSTAEFKGFSGHRRVTRTDRD